MTSEKEKMLAGELCRAGLWVVRPSQPREQIRIEQDHSLSIGQ
jgi:hypothetical protein